MPEATVGDRVVVPGCDLGEVTAVETLPVDGHAHRYYRIRIDSGARMWVPLHRFAEQGLRKVMTRDTALRVLELASSQEMPAKRQQWARRRRRYEEMLWGNSPAALGALLGELAAVRQVKGALSFIERQIYDKVRSLLVKEIAVALALESTLAERRIETALAG